MQPGQTLQQRYQLEKLLGQDNARETWLANDLANQPPEQVVVKLLAQNPEWQDVQLLEREATVLKNLRHPKIPRYRDAFSLDSHNAEGYWFGLVQTYVPGVTLRSLLDHHQWLTEKQARAIATQVLQILIHLHELNPPVLHRDIKPSNLLLGDDKQVYLIDFGTVQNRAKRERSTMTMVGTYGYTSLEQYRGQTVPASDLFALGTSLVHLITGVDPSDLPTKQLRIQFADDEGNLLGNHAPISPQFRRWLETLTQPAVENRFGSARQALEALQTGRSSPIALLAQPGGSRIQLQALPQELIIKIPALALSKSTIALSLLGVLAFGVLLASLTMLFLGSDIRFRYNFEPLYIFAATLWLAWLVMAIAWLKAIYAYTKYQKVRIDNTRFLLEWRSLTGRYRRQQGQVKDIQEVKQSVQVAPARSLRLKTGKTELEMVTIATAKQPYNLAIGCTAAECTWLTQEINQWLQDPPTGESIQSAKKPSPVQRILCWANLELKRNQKKSLLPGIVVYSLILLLSIPTVILNESFRDFLREEPQLSFLHPFLPAKPSQFTRSYPRENLELLTPLQLAARRGNLQQVNYLIKTGADVKGKEGANAFFQAARGNHTTVMQVLLQKGVNPNARNSKLLRHIVRENNAIAVKLLLQAGADPNVTDDGNSDSILLESLLGNPYTSFLSWDSGLNKFPVVGESRVEVVRALIEAGADPKDRDRSNGTNVLMLTAGQGHTDLMRLLIQKGANVNSPNAYGDTPLMYAARRGAIAAVKVLLDNEAKVNAPAPNPYHRHTPLMYAVKSGSITIVKLLLAKGADVNAFTNERDLASGKIQYFKSTVLDHALQIGDPTITAFLKKFGAKSYSQLSKQ